MKIFLVVMLFILAGCQTFGGFGGVPIMVPSSGHSSNYSRPPRKDFAENKNVSLVLGIGSYYHRSGVLEEAGEMGPTLSFDLDFVSNKNKFFNLGYTFFWSFDHFLKTKNGVLKREYWNKDFTNYMLGAGMIGQFNFFDIFRFSYQPGFAINFLEIDTNGPKNPDYKDTAFSLTHKLVFEFKFYANEEHVNGDAKLDEMYFGFSTFTYWTPSPLGKFLNDEKYKETTLNSSKAWMVHWKWEFL